MEKDEHFFSRLEIAQFPSPHPPILYPHYQEELICILQHDGTTPSKNILFANYSA